MLKSKTFWSAVLGILGAWAAYLGGSITLEAAIGATLAGVALIGQRQATERVLAAVPKQVGATLLALIAAILPASLGGCTTATPTVTQPSTVTPTATTGQGGTDSAAGQLFGFAVTRPNDGKGGPTPLAQWTFPGEGGTTTRPVVTLRRKLDPATGKVVEEWYEAQIGPDGKPLMESVAAGLFIDARYSTFTNSVTPQGAVTGSGTTQTGTAAPGATQTVTQTTSVPVTANVPVTLPNGTTIPAGGVIPAGTPTSVFPPGATVTPVQ